MEEENKMKNLIILKNLPSNLVEEAIVVLKKNIIKLPEHIEKKTENGAKANSKDYILREAESVVVNYINNIEKNKKEDTIKKSNIERKYKKLKIITILITIAFTVAVFF